MTIQVFLTLILCVVALLVAMQQVTSRLFRVSILLVVAFGIYLVWSPDDASRAAHALGVGRGADLIAYLWLIVSLGLVAFLYLKIVVLSRVVTELARAIALQSWMAPESQVTPANPDERK